MKQRKGILKLKVNIIKNRITNKELTRELKSNYSSTNIREFLTDLKVISPKRFNDIFIKQDKPGLFEDLKGKKLVYVQEEQRKLMQELNWNFSVFQLYTTEINDFLELKNDFERNIIGYNFDEARRIIEEIDIKICKSLWSIENHIILEEFNNGVEGRLIYLEKINEPTKNFNAVIKYLADFYSFKVGKSTSVPQIQNRIKKFVTNINSPTISAYFKFKLMLNSHFEENELTNILYFEQNSSIIDRYITTIKICQYILSNPDEFGHYFDQIKNLLQEISQKINDANIYNMLSLLNPKSNIQIDELSTKLYLISNLYTLGKYKECFDESKTLLKKYTNVIEIYEYYLKSSMYLFDNIQLLDENSTIQNIILEAMYDTYIRRENTKDSLKELLKISNTFGHTNFSVQLNYYVLLNNPQKPSYSELIFSELNSPIRNPRFYRVYKGEEDSISYLENLQSKYGENHTVSLFLLNYKNLTHNIETKSIRSLIAIPQIRKNLYLAEFTYDKGDYNKAVSILLNMLVELDEIKELPVYKYLYEKIITMVFTLYILIGDFISAMDLFIENYLNDKNLTSRMDLKFLVSKLQISKDIKVKSNINLSILSHIYYGNEYQHIFRCFANYLTIAGLEKPSDLRQVDLNQNQLIYFLRYVCSIDVLKLAFWAFKNEEEVRKERINICLRLLEMDVDNEYFYMKELTKLNQKNKVNDKLREIDESRIYVNVQGIKDDPDNLFKETYYRYSEIRKIQKDFSSLNISDKEGLNILKQEQGSMNLDLQDHKVLALEEVVIGLRDQFAFNNKYGLDSSLSTRIRHGALVNELRKPFENQNLILSKWDKHSVKYEPNPFWTNHLDGELPKLKNEFYTNLEYFSEVVDKFIENVNNEWMRVKTEEIHPKGLFDFRITNEDLKLIYNTFPFDDYDKFYEKFNQAMWKFTEDSLEAIKNILKNEIEAKLLNFLFDLETEILKLPFLVKSRLKTEILSKIANCRTEVQHNLQKIVRWFQLSQNQKLNNYRLGLLVSTSVEPFKSLNKYKDINITQNINCDSVYLGYSFSYLNDILYILISNAIQHSKFENLRELDIKIELTEDKNLLNILIENNLSNNIDIAKLRVKIQEINSKVMDKEKILLDSSKEGGSGFSKIFRIFYYNIMCNFQLNVYIKSDVFVVKIILEKDNLINKDTIKEVKTNESVINGR